MVIRADEYCLLGIVSFPFVLKSTFPLGGFANGILSGNDFFFFSDTAPSQCFIGVWHTYRELYLSKV